MKGRITFWKSPHGTTEHFSIKIIILRLQININLIWTKSPFGTDKDERTDNNKIPYVNRKINQISKSLKIIK